MGTRPLTQRNRCVFPSLVDLSNWSEKQTRHIAKTPASILTPRPLPPAEYEANFSMLEAPSGPAPFSPDTKAVAQAIVSLLRPMIGDIKDLADTRVDDVGEDLMAGANDHEPLYGGLDGSNLSIISSNLTEGQYMTSSSEENRSRSERSSEIIPVDISQACTNDEARQSLLKSLESLSTYLHIIPTQ